MAVTKKNTFCYLEGARIHSERTHRSSQEHEEGWQWWCTSLSPALRIRGRRIRISKFKASMVYRMSSKTARTTLRNSVLKTNLKQKTKRGSMKEMGIRETNFSSSCHPNFTFARGNIKVKPGFFFHIG